MTSVLGFSKNIKFLVIEICSNLLSPKSVLDVSSVERNNVFQINKKKKSKMFDELSRKTLYLKKANEKKESFPFLLKTFIEFL